MSSTVELEMTNANVNNMFYDASRDYDACKPCF